MFFHMNLVAKVPYEREGKEYEIVVYRVDEDGRLQGYVSVGGWSDLVLGMSGNVATDMKMTNGMDPVQEMLKILKGEIDADKYKFVLST